MRLLIQTRRVDDSRDHFAGADIDRTDKITRHKGSERDEAQSRHNTDALPGQLLMLPAQLYNRAVRRC